VYVMPKCASNKRCKYKPHNMFYFMYQFLYNTMQCPMQCNVLYKNGP